jgi:hypothetical protein
MRTYYIHNGEREVGPLTIEDLKVLHVTAETPIWYEGLPEWTTAIKITEVKTALQLSVPPPAFGSSKVTPPPYSAGSALPPVKKSKLGRNVLIGIGVVVFGLISLALIGSAIDDEYDAGNNDGANNDSAIEAVPAVDEGLRALTLKNREFRNNFEKYIRVSTNRYSVDTFGGISNLDVIVSNDTDYTLNEVTVNVDYIKDNGGIYKSEELIFYNVPAHQNVSLSAPDSPRGTSVDLRMDAIRSKKMHFCFYAMNGRGQITEPANPIDPYFCK